MLSCVVVSCVRIVCMCVCGGLYMCVCCVSVCVRVCCVVCVVGAECGVCCVWSCVCVGRVPFWYPVGIEEDNKIEKKCDSKQKKKPSRTTRSLCFHNFEATIMNNLHV